MPALATVFCDFNGTITDKDMLRTLVERSGKGEVLERIDSAAAGALSLRERIAMQAAAIAYDFEEAQTLLERELRFDQTFIEFHRACRRAGADLVVLSSGVEELILRFLRRYGLTEVTVIANAAEYRPDGWRMRFRDASPDGNAKISYVADARLRGRRTVVIGDDESDFDAAVAADRRFTKRASALERYLAANGLPHRTFATFAEITPEVESF